MTRRSIDFPWRVWVLVTALVALPAVAEKAAVSRARTPSEAGLVDVRRHVPDIDEDMKYAGRDNFTGAPVPGYLAPVCLLRAAAAEALSRVESALRPQGYRLRLWDCYRPARAVSAFVRWAGLPDDPRSKALHYPNLAKTQLLGEYIAPVSGHSRGATVDLTLMQCTGTRCTPLDMGTGFDVFDPRAHTDDPGITEAQRDNRRRLVQAMAAQGFVNYAQEWWHFTLPGAAEGAVIYDVPVR